MFLVVFLLPLVSAVCYIEDANADCAVCWTTIYSSANDTSGVTKMAKCPDEITVKWTTPLPTDLVELTDYPVAWEVNAPGVVIDNNHVPHANIHSCIRSVGACTPFVSNTPGLSTHTAASPGNFKDGKVSFQTNVNLAKQQYTIIAHTRYFVPGAAKPTKVDVAIGIARTVTEPAYESSTSSIFTAAIAGAIVVIFFGALAFGVYKRIINLEYMIKFILNEQLISFISIILGLSDVIPFTMSLVNLLERPSASTVSVIPASFLVCILAWILSLTKFVADARRIWLHKNDDNLLSEANRRMSRKKALATSTFRNSVNNCGNYRDDAIRLGKLNSRINIMYLMLVTLILEQVPMICISIYLMVSSESGVSLPECFTLLFSSIILGTACTRILAFPAILSERKELEGRLGTGNKVAPEPENKDVMAPVLP
jgi:hypothetical protein